MLRKGYLHTAHFVDQAGHSLVTEPIQVDFVPAIEWTRHEGLRRGTLPEGDLGTPVSVLPKWSPDKGRPFLSGFCVTVVSTDGVETSCDFAVTYFDLVGQQRARDLQAEGRDEVRSAVAFFVSARPDQRDCSNRVGDAIEFEEIAPHLSIEERSASDIFHCCEPPVDASQEKPSVFIEADVIAAVEPLIVEARPNEMAGILLGHLHRDSAADHLWLHVTGLLPTSHTLASPYHVRFTAETWSAARDAIGLRGHDEITVGWVHSHPAREWCKDCPPEKRAVCPRAKGFFSAQDRLLHRTVFPRAHSVALVATDTDTGINWDLFGWRHGTIQHRPHAVVSSPREIPREQIAQKGRS